MTGTAAPALLDHVDLPVAQSERIGWQICTGRDSGPITALIRRKDRLRVLVGEQVGEVPYEGLTQRVLGVARTLLVAKQSPRETADRLATLSIWPDLAEPAAPRLAITVIDLTDDGQAHVACRYSPSVMLTRDHEPVELLPLLPGTDADAVRLGVGDRLIAYTASFLGSLPPDTIARLPQLARDSTVPCQLWDHLVASRASSPDRGTPPDLVIVTRSGRTPRG